MTSTYLEKFMQSVSADIIIRGSTARNAMTSSMTNHGFLDSLTIRPVKDVNAMKGQPTASLTRMFLKNQTTRVEEYVLAVDTQLESIVRDVSHFSI